MTPSEYVQGAPGIQIDYTVARERPGAQRRAIAIGPRTQHPPEAPLGTARIPRAQRSSNYSVCSTTVEKEDAIPGRTASLLVLVNLLYALVEARRMRAVPGGAPCSTVAGAHPPIACMVKPLDLSLSKRGALWLPDVTLN